MFILPLLLLDHWLSSQGKKAATLPGKLASLMLCNPEQMIHSDGMIRNFSLTKVLRKSMFARASVLTEQLSARPGYRIYHVLVSLNGGHRHKVAKAAAAAASFMSVLASALKFQFTNLLLEELNYHVRFLHYCAQQFNFITVCSYFGHDGFGVSWLSWAGTSIYDHMFRKAGEWGVGRVAVCQATVYPLLLSPAWRQWGVAARGLMCSLIVYQFKDRKGIIDSFSMRGTGATYKLYVWIKSKNCWTCGILVWGLIIMFRCVFVFWVVCFWCVCEHFPINSYFY